MCMHTIPIPNFGRTTAPKAIICVTSALTWSIGRAKPYWEKGFINIGESSALKIMNGPMPADAPDGLKMAVLTPITLPCESNSGPPELPKYRNEYWPQI